MEEDFPSIALSMKRIAQETGAKLITVKLPENGDWTQAIKERLDNNIKVVAISSCHWTNGAYIDLLEIRKACDETGSILIVDATQTLGAIPFSIDRIKPDFLIACGYKWLLSPYGFTLLYVAGKWRNERPLEETWQARKNAEDFAGLVKYSDVYMPGTRRFDGGEKCTPTILPGAIAALEQIKKWGIKEIANSLSAINENIANHLVKLGFKLPDQRQRCPHMFGATIPGYFRGNLVSELKGRKIYVSQRGNAIRFAPYLYNDDNDVDRLQTGLNAAMKK
jgi:selenocysteine lyase/cysteine desulfurase